MPELEQITLTAGDKSVAMPVLHPTLGQPCIDIAKLPKETGCFTYDPGFGATASCKSAITYIDGDAGVLLYRGYPIEQLAEKSTFTEVAYLLMHGELPTQAELGKFEHEVTHHTMMHEAFRTFLYGFRHDAHPMAMLTGMLGSLASFYHNDLDLEDPEQRRLAAIRLIAKVPTIAAAHEQNASTSTVRLVGSTGANPYVSVAAGVAALWGPAHGGANEAVLKMLAEIGRPENVKSAVDKAKDKESGFRLMGFGHRVYKNYDPRAALVRKMTHEVLGALNVDDPLLEVAVRLEEAALQDEYFVQRKLYPNVDFYSGIIYKALGIPSEMFTVMFAIARTAGWVSHWLEQQNDPENRIGRPRQIYTGAPTRDYVGMGQR